MDNFSSKTRGLSNQYKIEHSAEREQKKSSSCKFTWSLFSLSDLLRPFFPNKSLLTKANPLPTLQTVAFFNRLFPPGKYSKKLTLTLTTSALSFLLAQIRARKYSAKMMLTNTSMAYPSLSLAYDRGPIGLGFTFREPKKVAWLHRQFVAAIEVSSPT